MVSKAPSTPASALPTAKRVSTRSQAPPQQRKPFHNDMSNCMLGRSIPSPIPPSVTSNDAERTCTPSTARKVIRPSPRVTRTASRTAKREPINKKDEGSKKGASGPVSEGSKKQLPKAKRVTVPRTREYLSYAHWFRSAVLPCNLGVRVAYA